MSLSKSGRSYFVDVGNVSVSFLQGSHIKLIVKYTSRLVNDDTPCDKKLLRDMSFLRRNVGERRMIDAILSSAVRFYLWLHVLYLFHSTCGRIQNR